MFRTAALTLVAACALVTPIIAAEAQSPAATGAHALGDLKATLFKIRREASLRVAPPDAGALVTLAKRQLLRWVEQQLPTTGEGDIGPLNDKLSAQLRSSGLLGPSKCSDPDAIDNKPPQSRRFEACGYVDEVELQKAEAGRDGPYLTLTTSFENALCGIDGSAYLFQFRHRQWELVWENEADAQSATYAPTPVRHIVVARRFTEKGEPEAPLPLVLTLSWALGCQGTWGEVKYNLWRVRDTEVAPPPLLSGQDGFWMGNGKFIDGQLLPDDLLVEYRNRSVDGGVHNRAFIYHFRIRDDDRVQRVAPIALNPRDFVDEWLIETWQNASAWTAPQYRRRLRGVHASVPNQAEDGFVSGEFAGPPLRCRDEPTLWQVGFAPSEGKSFSVGPVLYFIVRWMAPYRLTMVDVGGKPRSTCDVVDTMPDATDTLFAVTGSPWPNDNPFAPKQ